MLLGALHGCWRAWFSPQAPGSKAGGNEEAALDDTKFDEFMGNDAGVFAATGEYDEDDKEADAVWESVDNFMDERRRVRRQCWAWGLGWRTQH